MRKIDRFDNYMKLKGLNDNKVTVQLGLSIGTLGKSRKDGRDLSDKVIEQILNFYTDIDRIWLITGEGQMLKDTVSQTSHGDNSPNINGNGNHVQNTSALLDKALNEITELRKMNQDQFNRLMGVIERLTRTD